MDVAGWACIKWGEMQNCIREKVYVTPLFLGGGVPDPLTSIPLLPFHVCPPPPTGRPLGAVFRAAGPEGHRAAADGHHNGLLRGHPTGRGAAYLGCAISRLWPPGKGGPLRCVDWTKKTRFF